MGEKRKKRSKKEKSFGMESIEKRDRELAASCCLPSVG